MIPWALIAIIAAYTAGLAGVAAAVAYALGKRAGYRQWKADADRAYWLGVRQGRIEERAETGGRN